MTSLTRHVLALVISLALLGLGAGAAMATDSPSTTPVSGVTTPTETAPETACASTERTAIIIESLATSLQRSASEQATCIDTGILCTSTFSCQHHVCAWCICWNHTCVYCGEILETDEIPAVSEPDTVSIGPTSTRI